MVRTLEASCPGKVIAFGEWAVVKGYPGVGLPVDSRFRIRIVAKKGPKRHFKLKSCWIDSTLEFSDRPAVIPKDWLFFGTLFFETLFLTLKKDKNLNQFLITLDCDWDPREGLGSSSALVLCVLALNKIWNFRARGLPRWNHQVLFREGRDWIRKLQSPKASGLDLATQIYGKPTLLHRGKIKAFSKLKIPNTTVLIHTFKKFNTVAKLKKTQLPPGFYFEISKCTKKLLASPQDQNQFLESLRLHHDALSKNSMIVPKKLKAEMKELIDRGILKGIKTTGAGGGDALLGIANQDQMKDLKQWTLKKGYKLRQNSCFDTHGLRIHKIVNL
jgi:mevalonate kinase